MKRILSLALSLVLALTLVLPAAAAEDPELPLWQQYGFSSQEECIEYLYDGDAEAYQADVAEAQARQTWEKTDMAAQIAAFDADAYWNSDACSYAWYYDSKEAFMDSWALETQEEFEQTMLEDWLDQQWAEKRQATLVVRTRESLGGVAGQIGVMLDGTYLRFSGAAVPEVVGGRTMAPCRPVLEAFGGTVRHVGGEVVCTLDGAEYRLRSGSDTVSVSAGGVSSTLQLDAACYEKNGSTYLPLRSFAEAMGCDVLWDDVFQTAVLVRRDALVAKLDGNFTVLNRMLSAMTLDPSKNYKTAVDLEAKVTMLDSINGDKDYRMTADLALLQSGSVLDLTAKMDLSALPGLEDLTGELSLVETAALRSALKNMKIQLIYDGEGGTMYLKAPILSLLSQGALPTGGWLSIPAAPLDTLDAAQTPSVGALMYASALSEASYDSYGYYYEGMLTPVLLYQSVQDSADQAAVLMGDSCFQESGGYSVLHYGEADYNAALEAEYGEGSAEYLSEFEQLEADLKVARSGSATYRVLVQTKGDSSYYYDEPAILVDASGTASAAKVDLTLLVKVQNRMNVTLRYTASTAATQEVPRTAPPAGETVVDPYEALSGGEDAA